MAKHGLSNEEEWMREDRSKSRRNFYQTVKLGQQLQASRGKGKSCAAEHTGGTGSSSEDKQVIPKAWDVMSTDERWWLKELWSGNLEAWMRHAERKCHRVQAKDLVVNDDN